MSATPCDPSDAEGVRIEQLRKWLAVETDALGREHAVLSDGWHHIRLDVERGSITREPAVLLRVEILGLASAEPKVLPLRRLLALCRHGRFARALFPRDPRIARWVEILRVHDAIQAGASQREIATALFGAERTRTDWGAGSDSLRSQVRRLVRSAAALTRGGYRLLLMPSPNKRRSAKDGPSY